MNKLPVEKGLHLLIGALLYVSIAYAQPYYFRHYQVENGLSNNTVHCSLQDKNGFMWFGTKEGLNRFDGYHFKLFTLDTDDEQKLTSDFIYCLFLDRGNKLWVGSQKGLYWFDASKERLVRFLAPLPEVRDIQMDEKGQLWFISILTLNRYNFTTHTLKTFTPSRYFSATSLCHINSTLWAATPDGLLQKFDPGTETFTSYNVFSHSPPAASKWIEKMRPATNSTIFIGTSSQGVKQFDVNTASYKDLLIYNSDKTSVYVRDMVQYSPDEFWFATESGIFIWNTTRQKFINIKKKFLDPYSLSDNAVYTLCRDKEGGIWAGTYFGGINYYPKGNVAFQKYFPDYTENSISGSVVREICEDDYGNLWIGTEDAGLNKLNRKTETITRFLPTGAPGSIAYTNIHGLMPIGRDLWIGTFEHGMDILDIKTGKVKKHYTAGPNPTDLKSNFIVCFLHTKAGAIYIGASTAVYQYLPGKDGFEKVTDVPGNMFVSSMIEAADGTVYIGTHGNGVCYFNPVTHQKGHYDNDPNNKNSLSTNSINALYEDSQHIIWVATEGGGLCKLNKDKKTFSRYTTKNGMPSNFVFKIVEDNKNNLWASTSKGLISLTPDGKNNTIYTKANGLLNDQFNYNSGYKDATGRLYFGSVKGMIAFQPQAISQCTFIPPLYITGVQVHNKELNVNEDSSLLKTSIIETHTLSLPYNQSAVNIDFAALSFTAPGMTEYAYKMEGLDKEWTYIKSNRRAYFTNLSPGTYVFKVKAAINGLWNTAEKKLTIRILPPVWATLWAYLVYGIVGSVLFYYLIRSYHIIVNDKKDKEIYEAKIEFFTNIAHEIRTPLTLIKGPVENLLEKVDEVPEIEEDVLTMERNTNRLISLITQILDFRQTEARGFSLDFARVNISQFLREAFLNFEPLAKKKNLAYTMDLPAADLYAFADAEALDKILNNLLSNAVKYAHKEVHLMLATPIKNELYFTLEISNDGNLIPKELKDKIFEPFFRIRTTSRQKGTGIGLALARSLTLLHKGYLYLKDAPGERNIFVLKMPLKIESSRLPDIRKNFTSKNL